MVKRHYRRCIFTLRLILVLVMLELIQIWPIGDVPLEIGGTGNLGHAENEFEQYRRADGLVTVLPPYTEWKLNRDDLHARLSVEEAVRAVCAQAGVPYNKEPSHRNTHPTWARWIAPVIENMRPEDALDEILAPVNLTYAIEDNGLIMDRIEDGLEPTKRLVTLKSPYLLSKAPDTEGNMISLQYAVIAIGQQAGIGYNWDKSFENTDPICQDVIYPDMEDVPFDEAMEEILGPKGLTYVIESNQIVLDKETNIQ